jgi:hypothetical protein
MTTATLGTETADRQRRGPGWPAVPGEPARGGAHVVADLPRPDDPGRRAVGASVLDMDEADHRFIRRAENGGTCGK